MTNLLKTKIEEYRIALYYKKNLDFETVQLIELLEQRITELEEEVSIANEKADELESSFEDSDEKVDILEKEVENLKNKIILLEEEIKRQSI